MRYFNKLLTLVLCISSINRTEALNSDLNKTEIFSRKTSESFRNIYKNDSPKSSPMLYNSITISQNETNQSTVINIINDLQNNDITNYNQSTIININNLETDISNIFNINNNITLQDKENTLSKQRTFNSPKDFRDYYRLYPHTTSELGLYGSLFNLWHSDFKKEVEQAKNPHFQCIECVLSSNLLKTISYISKLFNYIRCDVEDLKHNPYVVKYVNKHLINMDVKDPRIDLFPEYYVNKYNKQYTDAITYVLYKTFSLLQHFINSLDFKENNYKSLVGVTTSNENTNKEQLNIIKKELKQQLKTCRDRFNKKSNECKDITKKLDCYKQYYNSNQKIFDQIKHKINKYTDIKNNSNDEIKKKEADNKLNEYNSKKTIIVNQMNGIEIASNKYTNKLKAIKEEVTLIQKELNKKYKEYCNIKQIMTDSNSVMKQINDNLEQYFNEKEQLDIELKNIYNNNKLLNPLKLNIIENSSDRNMPNSIEEACNELMYQKNNINNYIEILKDMMKQLFKIENNNKVNNTND